jgi:NADPH2:quinone reductase
MKTWRAEEFGDPQSVLKQVVVEAPVPGPGEVAVKVAACGVGLPDLLMVRGGYPLVRKPPISPGQEVVGTVIEAGEGAPFAAGDRVMTTTQFAHGHGGFSEVCLSNSWSLASLVPEGLSDEQAAGFLIPFHTAHVGLIHRGMLARGETLLVLGAAGSSGSAAIQLGKAVGATVIAAAGSPEKTEFCLSQGADHAIDYRKESVPDKVNEITAGAGANVIFDPVGGKAFEEATGCVAQGGRMVLIGFASGSWPELSAAHLVQRSYSVVGAFVPARTEEQVAEAKADLERFVESGAIEPPIDRVFEFDEVPELMQALADARTSGKLVLRVG